MRPCLLLCWWVVLVAGHALSGSLLSLRALLSNFDEDEVAIFGFLPNLFCNLAAHCSNCQGHFPQRRLSTKRKPKASPIRQTCFTVQTCIDFQPWPARAIKTWLLTNWDAMSCIPTTNKYTKNEVKEETKPTGDDVEILDWDAEEFELKEVDLAWGPDGVGSGAPDVEEEADEEWLVPKVRNGEEYNKNKTVDRELYLTDQFSRLNTPVSRKKPRCAACTRPLKKKESAPGSAPLCGRCSGI